METALVSIMIPNFNYAHYVVDAVKSACEQDYVNCEVTVVDNASTDNSVDILKALQKNYPFKIIQNPLNIGMVRNWQKCADLTEGKYFMWLSADDVLKPDFISSCVNIFERYNVAFVATDRMNVDESGSMSPNRFYAESGIIPGLAQAKVFLFANPFVPSHVLIKKSVIEKGFSLCYPSLADWELWFSLCLNNDMAYIDKIGVMYRAHNESFSAEIEKHGQLTMERYILLRDFLYRVKDIPELYQHKEAAYAKIADNALRYAYRFLVKRNNDAAKKYLHLAPVCDASIEETELYKDAIDLLNLNDKSRTERLQNIMKNHKELERTEPYPLPDGSKIITSILQH